MRQMTWRQEAVMIAVVAAMILLVGRLSGALVDRHLQYRAGAVAVVLVGMMHIGWRRLRRA